MATPDSVLATLGVVVMLGSFVALVVWSATDRLRRKRQRRDRDGA